MRITRVGSVLMRSPPWVLVRAVHDVLDRHAWLAVDAHGSCDPSGALRLAERLAPLDLRWLEDPVPPENAAAMAEVTAASPVPICTGENLYGVHGFRELLTRHGTDIASPDIAKTGGLAQGRRIADLAASYGVLMAPHDIGSPVQAVAAGHLACSLPNLLAMEQHFPDLPRWHRLIGDHQLIEDGELVVSRPAGPGHPPGRRGGGPQPAGRAWFLPSGAQTRHLIARNSPVAGHDREPLQTSLCDLDPIERVCMYGRKLGHGEGMAHGDRQVLEPFPFQGGLEIVRGVQLAELSLDGDLPGCRRAHEDRPARIGDELARPAGDRRRIVPATRAGRACRATARSVGAARKRRLHRRRQLVEIIGDPDLTAATVPRVGERRSGRMERAWLPGRPPFR